MATPASRRMTLAEFLEWDDGTDTRYELIDGEVVAMAPPPAAHALISMNIGRTIRNKLKPPCTVLTGAGVARPEWRDRYLAPDLIVTCSPVRTSARYIAEPRVVVEVLSASTRQHDRDAKLDAYRDFETVQELLFVWTTERRVQLWRRAGRRWVVEDFIGEATLELECVEVGLALAEVYADLVFDQPEEPAAGEGGN